MFKKLYGAYVVLALRQLWMIKTVCEKGNLGSKIEVCKLNWIVVKIYYSNLIPTHITLILYSHETNVDLNVRYCIKSWQKTPNPELMEWRIG